MPLVVLMGWSLMGVGGVVSVCYLAYAWRLRQRGERVPAWLDRAYSVTALSFACVAFTLMLPDVLLPYSHSVDRLLFALALGGFLRNCYRTMQRNAAWSTTLPRRTPPAKLPSET